MYKNFTRTSSSSETTIINSPINNSFLLETAPLPGCHVARAEKANYNQVMVTWEPYTADSFLTSISDFSGSNPTVVEAPARSTPLKHHGKFCKGGLFPFCCWNVMWAQKRKCGYWHTHRHGCKRSVRICINSMGSCHSPWWRHWSFTELVYDTPVSIHHI